MDLFSKRQGACDTAPYTLYGKNHFELGVVAALHSGKLVGSIVRMLARWAKRDPVRCLRVTREATARKGFLSRECPSVIRELEGLAQGLGMNVEDLLCARSILESCFLSHCTNFGAVPPATADQDITVSWNFDAALILKLIMGRSPLFVRDVEGTLPYVCLGVPALFGIGMLNAEGLCCVVNAVGMIDDGEGFSPFELNNMAMEACTTVGEAAGVIEQGPRQATKSMVFGLLMNWNTIWADRHGDLSVIEYSHNHFHREKAGAEGIIASANHHQFLDRSLSGSFDPGSQKEITGSYSRLARMWTLLREHHGEINPQVAKLIVSDHLPDYSLLKEFGIEREWWEEMVDNATICAHAWNYRRHLLKGEFQQAQIEASWSRTLYSLQIQPLTYTVWFTNGRPCRNRTRPLYWGRMLGVETQPAPIGTEPAEFLRPETELEVRGIFRKDPGPLEDRLARLWFSAVDLVEKSNFEKRDKEKEGPPG